MRRGIDRYAEHLPERLGPESGQRHHRAASDRRQRNRLFSLQHPGAERAVQSSIRCAHRVSLHRGGDYHAFEATVRKQFSSGIQFDLNYTLSKCIDLGSTRESDGPNGPQGSGLGLIQNPWNPGQERAVCDYDVRNLVSAFMVAELPFGRGRLLGGTVQ